MGFIKYNKDELDLTLNINVVNFNYVVYATTNVMKCFGGGETGHLMLVPKNVGNQTKLLDRVKVLVGPMVMQGRNSLHSMLAEKTRLNKYLVKTLYLFSQF